MTGLLEKRNLSQGAVKDVDTKRRIVTGYLSDFDSKDYHEDIIPRGAFKKTLQERSSEIYFLNQHNWAQPHGKFAILREDAKGLYFESNPLVDTSYSSDLIKLYEHGIVKEHSIGYQVVQSEKDKKAEARILTEIKLYEGSNVTMGANPNTPFGGFKCKSMKEANDMIKKLIKAVKSGTFTDETFILLEVALKELQAEAFELGKRESLKEPSNDIPTQESIELINKFNAELFSSIIQKN